MLETILMRRIKKVLSEGSNTDTVFFQFFSLMGQREDWNATISGPSLARQRNAFEMVFRWRADNGPPLNAALVALWF